MSTATGTTTISIITPAARIPGIFVINQDIQWEGRVAAAVGRVTGCGKMRLEATSSPNGCSELVMRHKDQTW
jgi:hypothetical protein